MVELYKVTIYILFPQTWEKISHCSNKIAFISNRNAFLPKTETEKKTVSYCESCHDDLQLAHF